MKLQICLQVVLLWLWVAWIAYQDQRYLLAGGLSAVGFALAYLNERVGGRP
jgi:hypothetical protein